MGGNGRLEADSRRYYRNGWRLLEQTKIAGMRNARELSCMRVENVDFDAGRSDEVGTGKGRQDQGGEPAVQKSIKLI